MKKYDTHIFAAHEFPPVFDACSKVLILGTMPSLRSKQNGFYYTHPQNRFWSTLSWVLDAPVPQNNDERRALVLSHGIALWDVLSSCEIKGSDDASIKNPVSNDLSLILSVSPVKAIFTTGRKATALYEKLIEPLTKRPCIYLPSTSPANRANADDEFLRQSYLQIKAYL